MSGIPAEVFNANGTVNEDNPLAVREAAALTAATGAKMTCTAASTAYSVTGLTAESVVRVVCTSGLIYIGWAAVYNESNEEAPTAIVETLTAGAAVDLTVPAGVTTLHYGSDIAGSIGRISVHA